MVGRFQEQNIKNQSNALTALKHCQREKNAAFEILYENNDFVDDLESLIIKCKDC